MTKSCAAPQKRSLINADVAVSPTAIRNPAVAPPTKDVMPILLIKIAITTAVTNEPTIATTIEMGDASAATSSAVLPMPANHCLLKANGAALNQTAPMDYLDQRRYNNG